MFLKFIIAGIISLLLNILHVNALNSTDDLINNTTGIIINTNNITDDKIVGGSQQSIYNRRFQVVVLPASYICGGSLIRYKWVITAAHCTKGIPSNKFKIRAGSNYYYKGGYLRGAKRIYTHYGFNFNTMSNDIAIIKLKSPFYKSNRIIAIKIANKIPRRGGTKVIVSGYGTTSSNGNIAPYLKSVTVRIIGFRECNYDYYGLLTKTMFCAGVYRGGKDSCQGDSGGPLTHNGRLVGVVSFGNGCGLRNYPGVYTRVPLYRRWIKNIIK